MDTFYHTLESMEMGQGTPVAGAKRWLSRLRMGVLTSPRSRLSVHFVRAVGIPLHNMEMVKVWLEC